MISDLKILDLSYVGQLSAAIMDDFSNVVDMPMKRQTACGQITVPNPE